MKALYKAMNIPESCYLGKPIFKKLFYEKGKLKGKDKKNLQNDVHRVLWQYTLKATTIQILPYQDSLREYLEIAILEIHLEDSKNLKAMGKIIHQIIPYPLVILWIYQNSFVLSMAHKRFSKLSKEVFVVENILMSPWISIENPNPTQTQFIESLDLSRISKTHFFAFYKDLERRLIALNRSVYTKKFSLETHKGISLEEQVKQLSDLEKLQEKQKNLQKQIKMEKNLAKQVDLNIKIKKIRDTIQSIQEQL